jgi:integrase/recombinase XerC
MRKKTTTGGPTSGGGGVLGAFLAFEASAHSPETVRLRETHLRRLRDNYDLDTVTEGDLVEYLNRQDWKPATVNSWRSTINAYFKWAVRHGLREDNPAENIAKVRGGQRMPKVATEAAIDVALSKASGRDRIAVLLAAYAGLRRAEIARLHAEDIGEGWLRVVGKGDKERRVPIHPLLAGELARVKGIGGYVFPSRDGDSHATPDAIGRRIARLLPEGTTAHSLRHAFATRVYRTSHDIRATQELLGHNSVATTQIYAHVEDDDLTRAVLGMTGTE